MTPINGFILISLLITFGYLVGLLVYLTDYHENDCEMTYMFEYPQFVRISNEIDKHFSRYGLYVYSEGRITERARKKEFDGIPVLFVPGNCGSYKQVRSLASVALRKAMYSRSPYHFDYFTIDLNEELSGLNGAILNEQMEYANKSMFKILELYNNTKNRPKSVVLIGHSMGGVIVRKIAFSLQELNMNPIVMSLSSPIKRAPVVFDSYLHSFYESDKVTPEKISTTFVSISGGYNDQLIPTTLTDPKDNITLYAVSSQVPLSWAPVDHLCILWCKELIQVINRALFESVDIKTKQISSDFNLRRSIFDHHLIHNSGTKIQHKDRYNIAMRISGKGDWVENLSRQHSFRFLKGVKEIQWIMIRLVDDPKHEMLTAVALNLEVMDWAFVCGAHYPEGSYRVCFEAVHLSHLSEISPSVRYKRRSLTVNMHELKKNYSDTTHVVLRVLPTNEPVVIHTDVYKKEERSITVDLPKWWTFFKRTVLINETPEKFIHYEFILPYLTSVIQTYYLYVHPLKCSRKTHHATASLTVPWANEAIHEFFTDKDKHPFYIRLHNSKPQKLNSSAMIKLKLDPTCRYQISIKSSLVGNLSQMARFYSPLLIVNIATIVLLSFRAQLKSMGEGKGCCIFFTALKEGSKPYYVLTTVKIISRFISAKPFNKYVPVPDWLILNEDGTDFFFLPLLLYMTSVGLVWMLSVLLGLSITVCESTVHKVVLKFLAKTVTFTVSWSDYFLSALQKVPLVVACFLVFISISTCGSLALCVGTIFYLMKLTQMSQDYMEEVIYSIIKRIAKKCKQALIRTRRHSCTNENTEDVQRTNEDNLRDQTKEINSEASKTTLSEGIGSSSDSVAPADGQLSSDDIAAELNVNATVPNLNSNTSLAEATKSDDMPNESVSTNRTDIKVNENQKNKLLQSNIKENGDKVPMTSNKTNQFRENVLETSPHNAIFFHITVFMLWAIETFINIPSILTWAHNYQYKKYLQPDPSLLPGLVFSVCAIPLWQFDWPNVNKKWYEELGHVILSLAVVTMIYAPICIFRLNYILCCIMVLVTIHQLFAPIKENTLTGETDEVLDKFKNLKAKIE